MHLLLVLHGMAGCAAHVSELAAHIGERHPSLHVLVSKSNTFDKTYDGIDYGAHRVLDELDDHLALLAAQGDPVSHLSIAGYSLGGLVGRYLIGLLYHRGFFDKIQPMNFATFTTPHVGVPPYPYMPYIYYWLGSKFLARTGKQLYCLDAWSNTGRPLLEVMADKDFIFHQALSRFNYINLYANAVNDLTVPYYSAAIEEQDVYAEIPQQDITPRFIPGYEPVLASFTVEKRPAPKRKPPTFDGPLIEWVYPWNLILYALTPVFVVGFFLYLPFRYTFLTFTSRSRITKLLTQETTDPTLAFINSLAPSLLQLTTPKSIPVAEVQEKKAIMTELQKFLIQSLNEISHMHKHTVFRPWVYNSHAMMICLDARFEQHRQGRGVLRHWAENFVV